MPPDVVTNGVAKVTEEAKVAAPVTPSPPVTFTFAAPTIVP